MGYEYKVEFTTFAASNGIIMCSDLPDAQRRYAKLFKMGRTPSLFKVDGSTEGKDKRIKWKYLRQSEE